MRRKVQIVLRGTTQTRANAHKTWIDAQLAGRSLYNADTPTAVNNEDGAWTCRAETRFTAGSEADIFYTAAVTKMQADPTIATGSEVYWHDCTHDEVKPVPCVVAARVVK